MVMCHKPGRYGGGGGTGWSTGADLSVPRDPEEARSNVRGLGILGAMLRDR